MDEKDWFDPWPLMNFSPVSFWIHSNVMVNQRIKVWLAAAACVIWLCISKFILTFSCKFRIFFVYFFFYYVVYQILKNDYFWVILEKHLKFCSILLFLDLH